MDSQWTQQQVADLWSRHRGWVAALLYAHMPLPRSSADVNDLLQEVAVSLVANIHSINSPEKIAPWLRTVAINIARDAGRRKHVRRNTHNAGDHLDALPFRPRSIENESAKERGQRALEIVHTLSSEYRDPLILNLRGLSQKQVADVLELPMSTIETRIYRARQMVRQEMESQERMELEQENRHSRPPQRVNCSGNPEHTSLAISMPVRK